VIELGGLSVYDTDSFNHSRLKLLRLAEGLGFDEIHSTKLTTFFSELCRLDENLQLGTVLDLELHELDEGLALSLFMGFGRYLSVPATVRNLFGRCSPAAGEPFPTFHGLMLLPEPRTVPEDYPVAELRKMLDKPSIEELMRSISSKNAELAEEIDERQRTEAALRDSEKRINAVLEGVPDALLTVNRDGLVSYVNSKAVTMFGYAEEELLGKSIDILVPEEVRSRHFGYVRSFFSLAADRELSRDGTCEAVTKSGARILVDINLSYICSEDEPMVIASIRDVTEQRKAQELIRKLSMVVEQNPVSVVITDRGGTIEYVNPAFCDVTGYCNDEVIGKTPKILNSGKTPREKYVELWDTILSGRSWKGELLNKRKDGEEYWEKSTIAPIFDAAGEVSHFVAVKEDITEQLRAQEERDRAAKELDERNHELGELSNKLSKYLSPQVFDSIFSGAREVELVTERKKLTVLFSDIKNFTATTDDLEPEDITYLLNDYLSEMSSIALKHGATIDKFIGDAMVLFFGDPHSMGVKEDALTCVRMAIAMQRHMVGLRAKWVEMGYARPFQMRIGINTGFCNVGNFGSDQRMDYTIVGGEVNLAARLERVSDADGIMLSYETYALVKDFIDAEPCDPISVKGIHRKINPYRLIGIYKNVDEESRFMRAENEGMKIFLDFDKLDVTTKPEAIRKFETALARLRSSSEES